MKSTIAFIWLVFAIGWIANLIQILGMLADPITGLFILKIVGIFAGPIGSILGFIGMF